MVDFKIKVAILGDSAVGKTSIVLKFVEDSFFEDKVPNVQESMSKEIAVESKRCAVDLCDTGGHEQFRAVTASHFRGAEALAVVFDVTRKDTFERVSSWLEEADMYIKKGNRRLLIGNKCDLETQRQVSVDEARSYAQEHSMQYFECSAKTGRGISEPFAFLAREGLTQRIQSGALNSKDGPEVSIRRSSAKGGCYIL